MFPFDYLSNQEQWKSTKKMHFKRNNSSHSCRTFSTVELFCRSSHAEHFWSLNLISISYSFWNKGWKVLKFWWNQRLPGACYRSPGSKLLSITTQLHCGGHLGGRAWLPDTILQEDHPMTIPSKFGSNWATGSRHDGFYVNFQ